MIYLIATLSDDEIIGVGNRLPWYLPVDLKWFKMHTMNGSVIMGRKTWESLPTRPLENRMNIILTRGFLPKSDGNVYWTNSFADAIHLSRCCKTTYIIGGSDVFHTALLSGLVDGLIITRVHVTVGDGKSLILPLQKTLTYRSKKQVHSTTSYHYEMYKTKT